MLHYPSEKEFVRELTADRYDYVGISFVVATFHKVRRMVQLIRRYSPDTQIVLGGYGTVLPQELLAPFADHVCREEGIAFMRRLLGEPLDQPIEHPYAPIPSVRAFSFQRPQLVGHLTAGLGCPNGCDFCCTSHFFKRKYVPYLKTGRELFEALRATEKSACARGEELSGFILIDEDFFLHERRAHEFLQCVRAAKVPTPGLMGFGSVRGLSKFTADEIAEMGFDAIWTAFEGTESGYGKLQGKPLEELYTSLKSRGISLLSSMIIGFPYQDQAQVEKEFGQLMALEPSMTQILIYFAFPGTPFHAQVVEEGRYLPEYARNPDLRRWDGFSMHFRHPHFSPPAMETLQKNLFRADFERLGPSLVRVVQAWLEGYKNLRNSPIPQLRARAERLRREIVGTYPALVPAVLMGPTAATRTRAREVCRRIKKEIGPLSLKTWIQAALAPALAIWTWLVMTLRIFQEPGLLRVCYRLPNESPKLASVFRLQGGLHARPFRVLWEDLRLNLKRLVFRLVPSWFKKRDRFSAAAVTRPASDGTPVRQTALEVSRP